MIRFIKYIYYSIQYKRHRYGKLTFEAIYKFQYYKEMKEKYSKK